MRFIKILFHIAILVSCKKAAHKPINYLTLDDPTNLFYMDDSPKVFYKLISCEKQLCVRSFVRSPKQVDLKKELKTFDSVKIEVCRLQQVPKISTAKCKELNNYNSSGRSKQLSLVEIELSNFLTV